jgi:hypothetical protein
MSTTVIHSDLPDDLINLAEGIQLDALLDHPATVNQAIRFICACRKALMEVPPEQIDDDLARTERVITRLYDRLGFERRQAAYADGAYHSSAPHLN